MCLSGGDCVNTGRVDAGMVQKIRKGNNILLHTVKYAREKMPQVVRKNLCRCHPGFMTQRFHGAPNAGSIQWASALCHKDTAALDSPTFYVSPELFAKIRNQKDAPRFPLTADSGLAALHRVYRNVCQFADSDPRAANGLKDQREPLVAAAVGSGHKAHVLLTVQFPFLGTKGLPLDTELLDSKIKPAAKAEEGIQRGQHGISAGHGIPIQ